MPRATQAAGDGGRATRLILGGPVGGRHRSEAMTLGGDRPHIGWQEQRGRMRARAERPGLDASQPQTRGFQMRGKATEGSGSCRAWLPGSGAALCDHWRRGRCAARSRAVRLGLLRLRRGAASHVLQRWLRAVWDWVAGVEAWWQGRVLTARWWLAAPKESNLSPRGALRARAVAFDPSTRAGHGASS